MSLAGFLADNGINSYNEFVKSIILQTEVIPKLGATELTPAKKEKSDFLSYLISSFLVMIGSNVIATCRQVSALSYSRECQTVFSGGDNGVQYQLPGPVRYQPVTLSGVYTSNTMFYDWLHSYQNLGSAIKTTDLSLIQYRSAVSNNPIVWTMHRAFPTGWGLSTVSLTASKTDVIYESVTMSFDYLSVSYG